MAEKQEYPFVIGTSGHIDHGKTSLVEALTGIDTDRLSEEKRRGMTIELGFAPLRLPSGKIVSIVDVPGHEKFIRQMVAGAAGIDADMLVVAADDGVMPQTREHLEILSLLGVKNGITVINKIDIADSDIREMAFEDVRTLLRGTFLEDKPVFGVSAVTREGIPELIRAIEAMITAAPKRERGSGFFLPVDRAFHMSGFGTVVTGTAALGTIMRDAAVEVMPGGVAAKVRSLQVHGAAAEAVFAGQRTAINLSGISLDDIKRGNVVAAKGRYSATTCLGVQLDIPRSSGSPIEHWQRVRLHVGTSDILARVSLLEGEKLAPGESSLAQLLTEEPICTYCGAHFIIRSYSPLRTIGGGKVLLTLGRRSGGKKARSELSLLLGKLAASEGDVSKRLLALLESMGIARESELLKLMEADIRDISSSAAGLEMKGKITALKSTERYFFSRGKIDEIKKRLLGMLAQFHAEHPERKGMEADEAVRRINLPDARIAKELLRRFNSMNLLSFEDEKVKLVDFVPLDEDSILKKVEDLRKFAEIRNYNMPTIEEARLFLKIDNKEMNRVLAFLKDNREAVVIGDGLILFSFLEEDFKRKLSALPYGNITLAAARDAAASSRKYILPLLEYFDSRGRTRRAGDRRILLK